jgi:hypothetical protein
MKRKSSKKPKKFKPALKRGKPVRSKENPVKVTFQCVHGIASARVMARFVKFLRGQGVRGLFRLRSSGKSREDFISKGRIKHWKLNERRADLMFSYWPADFYKRWGDEVPKHSDLFWYGNYMTEAVTTQKKKDAAERRLFEAILKRAKQKFKLEIT